MQTVPSSFEQQQQPLQLVTTTTVECPQVVTTTTLDTSFASETITTSTHSGITSSEIRPLTPEVTYPYPLYKSEEYYNRKLMMKPNQVSYYKFDLAESRFYFYLFICLRYAYELKIGCNLHLGWDSIPARGKDCFLGNGRKRTSLSSSDIEYPFKRLFI